MTVSDYCDRAAALTPDEVFQGRTDVVPVYRVENGQVVIEYHETNVRPDGHTEITDTVVPEEEVFRRIDADE